MKKAVFLSKKAADTQKFAGELIKKLLKNKPGKKALVLALVGELGAGKTTFVQGLAKALAVKEKITSPTFVIIKRFNLLACKHFSNLFHVDCYRLNGPKELTSLNFKEIISRPENIVVIEWAEKIKSLLPKEVIWLKFEWGKKGERKIQKKALTKRKAL